MQQHMKRTNEFNQRRAHLFFTITLNFRHSGTVGDGGKKGQCLLWQGRTFKRKGLESLISPEEDFTAGDGPLAPGNFEGPHPAFLTTL